MKTNEKQFRRPDFCLLLFPAFPNVSGAYFLCQFKPTASQHQFTPLIQTWLSSICALCLISKAEDQSSGTLVLFHISGTPVIASQPLLLNCLLMFTDVCPQVVLFSPITDSTKKYFRHPAITMEPGRRRHSCVPAANRSYRRSSTRSEASRLDDHDMLAFDEFLGHATHLENCTVTWTFCSLQV